MMLRSLIAALLLSPSVAWALADESALRELACTGDSAALQSEERALQASPTIQNYLTLGDFYESYPNRFCLNVGRDADAKRYYKAAVDVARARSDVSKLSLEARHKYAKSLLASGEINQALRLLKEAVDMGHVSSVLLYADVLAEHKPERLDEVVSWYRFALREDKGEAGLKLAQLIRDGRVEASAENEAEQLALAALAALSSKAADGSSSANYLLGRASLEGSLLPKDDAKALAYFEEAAARGHTESALKAAQMLAAGIGSARDGEKATRYVLEAAKKGSLKAASMLGSVANSDESGLLLDEAEALEWLKKAAASGHDTSMDRLARYHIKNGNPAEAIAYLDEAGNRGVVTALLTLYRLYFEGDDVPQSNAKALGYVERARESAIKDKDYSAYTKIARAYVALGKYKAARAMLEAAAEAKYQPAIRQLADDYMKGRYGAKDEAKAVYYYEQSIASGDTDAMFSLAKYYDERDEIGDDERAEELFKKAEEQIGVDDYADMAMIGNAYRKGIAVDQDPEKAFELLNKAVEGGSVQAKLEMARLVKWGVDEHYPPRRIVSMLEEAAEAGLGGANYELALIYLGGAIEPVDHDKAYDYMSRSAAEGHVDSIRKKALMLMAGQGAKRDVAQGVRELERAAEQGSDLAMLNLAHYFRYPPQGGSSNWGQYMAWAKRAADAGNADAQYVMGTDGGDARYMEMAAKQGHFLAEQVVADKATHE